MKLFIATALVCTIFVAMAADGYQYPMPTESARDGESQCGRMANTQTDDYFGNWVLGGKGAKFSLAQAKEYYGTHSGQNTDAAHNELVGNHLQRIWSGKYQSKTESTADFYAKCLDSDLRKILDKKWVKK